jgi:hypothetical protein
LNQYSQDSKKQDKGLKIGLFMLALVPVCAVVWVIFLADDGANNRFNSGETVTKNGESALETTPSVPEVIIPSFDVVRISRNGTGVIAGRAAPNSDVYIYAYDKKIGTAITDRNGEWVLLFDDPLPVGPTELSITSKVPGGFEVSSNDIVIVAVPDRNEKRFNDDDTDGVVAILTPRSGNGPSRVLQKPKNINMVSATRGLSLDALDYTDNGKTVITGGAEPGANIRIYLDNEFVGEIFTTEEGGWSLELEQPLTDGEHILRLDQILLDGNVEIRISQPFTPFVAIDQDRAKGNVIVKPGNSLWHISRKLYGTGFHYTVIFGANRESILDPNLIFPGQQLTLPLEQMR